MSTLQKGQDLKASDPDELNTDQLFEDLPGQFLEDLSGQDDELLNSLFAGYDDNTLLDELIAEFDKSLEGCFDNLIEEAERKGESTIADLLRELSCKP